MRWYVLLAAALIFTAAHLAHGCDSGLYLRSVSGQGEIVSLDDGSTWRVLKVHRVHSRQWLPTDKVTLCEDDGIMINTTPRPEERVEVNRLGGHSREYGRNRRGRR